MQQTNRAATKKGTLVASPFSLPFVFTCLLVCCLFSLMMRIESSLKILAAMDEGIDSRRIGVKRKMQKTHFSHKKIFGVIVAWDAASMERRGHCDQGWSVSSTVDCLLSVCTAQFVLEKWNDQTTPWRAGRRSSIWVSRMSERKSPVAKSCQLWASMPGNRLRRRRAMPPNSAP